jgi:hypothetical protein
MEVFACVSVISDQSANPIFTIFPRDQNTPYSSIFHWHRRYTSSSNAQFLSRCIAVIRSISIPIPVIPRFAIAVIPLPPQNGSSVSGRFAGGIFWFFCTLAPFGGQLCYSLSVTDPMGALAPFGAIASDGTDPVGALSSVAPFAPDRRNSLATDFLSMSSARAICRRLIPEAKSCVIPCVLSIESLFGIGDSSTEVTKHPLKKSTASSLSNWPLLKAP